MWSLLGGLLFVSLAVSVFVVVIATVAGYSDDRLARIREAESERVRAERESAASDDTRSDVSESVRGE